ncbi:CheR family methyltransferase [Nannocystis exedens]|uniref:CheR family methyltransferase n=1 Tax=Nannocystis exedens TaxID=54 RepID=UPI0015A6B67F
MLDGRRGIHDRRVAGRERSPGVAGDRQRHQPSRGADGGGRDLRASSFRTTPEERRERWFEPLPSGQWRALEPLRRMCTFVHLNLLDTARYGELGAIDTIFCRNVLMYLSSQARRRVVEGFYDALVPGGYLLLGHSESLISVPGRFDLVNLSNDLVYRKPG